MAGVDEVGVGGEELVVVGGVGVDMARGGG